MKKVFTLLTLLLAVYSGAWAQTVLCSAQIPTGQTGTFSNTEGLGQTNCTLKYSGLQGGTNVVTVNGIDYYKMGSGDAYVQLILTSGNFIAGDVLTATVTSNGGSNEKTVDVKVKESSTSTVSVKGTETKNIVYTLTASDIEDDGSIKIYRNTNGSNLRVSVFSVSGVRATSTYTVTFNAGTNGTCATESLTEENPGDGITLPAVTANTGYSFNGWFTAASEGTKVGNAGSLYKPTANITLYAQYVTPVAPGISVDETSLSTPIGTAVTFTATPTGSPAPTVTWYQSATAVTSGGTSKGTGNTYSPDVSTEGTFYYYAVASNGVEPDATSSLITLTVTSPDVDRTGYNTYYIAKDELPLPNERIFCDDITMTFVNGKAGETFVAGIEDLHLKDFNAKYEASISASSGNNGWSTKFAPTANGTLSVGVIINNNKTFTVTNVTSFSYEGRNNASTPSNVSATIDGNSFKTGESTDDKLYVIVTLSVEKDKEYSLSVAGSKMGFFGFEFTPTPANVPVTLATSGKSTFASHYAIDCANLPSGLKAYKVSATSSTSATLTEVTEAVAAGTGLILIGTGSTPYDIPVAATGTDISASNELVGVTADKALTAGEAFLLKDGTFVPCTAGTLPAGKAYLPKTTTARSLSLVFEGETTGINAIENAETINGIFNLNGQRVAQPTRGLYIMNGKKIIVK